MIDALLGIVTYVSDLVWGPWTMLFIAFVSVFVTVRSGFLQLTRFGYILRQTFGGGGRAEPAGTRLTPFQAAATSLAGTVGMGNMAAVQMGMARGMLSNEAGLGTSPMVHAGAATSHPFRQGMWGAAEVFVDTMVVCTVTALAILSTGVLQDGESGIEMLLNAFATFYSAAVANAFVSVAILTFCLTTQIGFYVYFKAAMEDLFGSRAFVWLRWLYFLPGVLFAGVTEIDELWAFANISVAASAIPNLVALLALSGVFVTLSRDFLGGELRYATAVTDRARRYVREARQRQESAL